jgi:lysophospholipase L1-like esterase
VEPTRILITGDSITQGYHGDYTWRYRLAKEFVRQNTPVAFVGSYREPFIVDGFTSTLYRDPHFDSNHFARVGARLLALKNTIEGEVGTHHPDVIVLAAGVNDILHGATPAETNARLMEWINNARAGRSNVRIILSPVLDIDRANLPNANGDIAIYGRLLRTTALAMNTQESPITVADTTRDWLPTNPTYSIDGIHPAPTGETIIAQRIAETMQGLDLLKSKPQIAKLVPWARTLKPRVAFSTVIYRGRRVKRVAITWYAQSISGATLYSRRSSASLYRYHGGGKAVLSVSPGVTYIFRLRLKRARVTGPWGPSLTVRAPRL